MKKTVIVAVLLGIFLIACVPEPEPYTLPSRVEEPPIEEQIQQIEEQARETAREKMEEIRRQEEEAQASQSQPAPQQEPIVQVKDEQVQAAKIELGEYPDYFMAGIVFKSNFITVVGEEAPSSYVVALSNLMARTPGNKPTGFSMLAGEIADISRYNAIVVGNPCNNAVISRIYGNPFPCEDAKLPDGKGLIRLIESANGNVALLALGKTDALVVSAVNAIGKGQFDDIESSEICVHGTSLVTC